jgi:hypothetical protein
MNIRVFAFSSVSALVVTAAVAACSSSDGGGGTIPTAPTASPNITGTTATPFQFNQTGVFVGTEGFQPIVVQNIGSQDMVVSSVGYNGDGEIAINPGIALSTNPDVLASTPLTVPYNASLVVSMTCIPEAVATYNGTVDIKSNATNLPDISIVMQCMGVDAGSDAG